MNMLKVIIVGMLIVFAFGLGYSFNKKSNPVDANQTNSNILKSASKTLDLSGQQLTTIPDYVLSQTDITSLNLSNNQLVTIPPGIGRLVNLEILNLENNRLESLPAEIGLLKKLTSADFSNNRLTALPAELSLLTQLKTLNINGYKGPESDLAQLKSQLPTTNISL